MRTDPPKFDILKHYHIAFVLGGHFANLWQDDREKSTLVSNNLKERLKIFQANAIKYDAAWNNLEGIFLLAKFATNIDDPMFDYAKNFYLLQMALFEKRKLWGQKE
ncbi:hypothetical protein [Candidatus Bartonella washoeensis]|uniref:hypothetical protein n=1 Tax=Candidatus Bartonella washoeensis TaxID=186739 RepID=UPI00031F8FD6|nr:hypothetical protein [Bartonella washoeensis]